MEGQPAATISRKWHQTTLLKHFCILTYLGFDSLQRFCMAGCETAWHLRLFQSLVFFSCIFHQGPRGIPLPRFFSLDWPLAGNDQPLVIQSTHVHLHSNFGASQLKVRFGSWPIGANDIASATLRICAHRSDQNVYCLKFMSKLKSLRSLRSFSRFPVAGPTDPVEICGLKLVCRGGLKLDPTVLSRQSKRWTLALWWPNMPQHPQSGIF